MPPYGVCCRTGSSQLVYKYPGGNEHKWVLKGSPVKGQMVNILGFMGHGICVNSPVPMSLQKQPQTVYKHTGVARPIKTIHRNRRLYWPRGLVSLCLLPSSLSTQRVRRPLACPELSATGTQRRGAQWQRAMPVEGLHGPFPDGSASAVIFILSQNSSPRILKV